MEGGFASYHVTINHRGPDVKKTLASLIYRNLRKYGLRVFLDVEELQTGDSLSLAIDRAIQSASLHICIFSETYAESAWCFNELVWILACENAKVIPIFYGIQPSDLRYTVTGAYAEAFRNHRIRGRVDTQRLKIWQNALNKVSHISGLVFVKEKDDLGELMDRIEDTVLREVRREALDVARYPVGLDKAAEHFQNEVFYETELSDIKVVGIVGPGGSGKSTLARHLYNAKRFEFSRCCFLSEVSEKKLSSVQQKLVTKLVGLQPHEHIDNTSEGRSMIQHRLAGYRVFIVFDGVDNMDQMENLLFVVKKVIGPGSLIFVTSRDRGLLASSEIKTLYDVKLLNAKDSQKLFCFHAFQRPEPSEGFQDLVHELVNLCGGFPLALKVLGGYLSGKSDRSYWIRQVGNFRKQLPENILDKVLRQSYDSLEREEKEAFLDVAHFLVGENKDLAIRVLDGLGHSGKDCLDTLHQKGLVEFQSLNVEDQYIMPFDELGNTICISTYNTVSSSKWREILSFPSSVSTAILYGATVNMEDIGEMEGLAHSYQDVTVRGIPSGLLETGMPVSVKFVYGHLEGAILVCLVAHKCCKFEVTVGDHTYNSSCVVDEMNTSCVMDDGDTNTVHMMMWTKDSQVFKDFKFSKDETVFCKIKLLNSFVHNRIGLNQKMAGLKQGWIVTVKNLELCKRFVSSIL
ncbi:hypothetical protein SUGI_0559910 [Cryptomeria japonica]|nr:hypothetical protein SUGI_0559910 [Cryptomeria japonica]